MYAICASPPWCARRTRDGQSTLNELCFKLAEVDQRAPLYKRALARSSSSTRARAPENAAIRVSEPLLYISRFLFLHRFFVRAFSRRS